MNIIFFSRREGRARHFNLGHPLAVGAFATVLVAILATAFSLGLKIGESKTHPRGVASWSQTLAEQQSEIKELKAELQRRVDAVAMRIGQMNAHVIRLDALGKRLTQMANIDNREFDFESQPAVGGPESDIGAAMQAPDLNALLNGLEQKISSRDAQLAALENALLSKKLDEQIRPDGRPVHEGHISSYFGERQDPFNGHQAFHKGIDFASPQGSDVVAVAAGVVTFAGEKAGYGNLVEVSHGNGLITRYGHNQSLAVGVGRTVARGDTLAYVGSTGRSTGPHVHFEVLKAGRQIDPLTFIGRN
ncbi:MAG TPA: peptidoglycan DD-metalloendopeptidase family protein [Steroidobacteraceae bacterium]|jgi:murein DD-endopeptidase MepM/ murein hydrolase activator NlpD|nr:peptidoglycan DD-metalloendopeptidase family protein [Steroidobacteraceae bacterium]